MFLVPLQPALEMAALRQARLGQNRALRLSHLENRTNIWKPAIELENRENVLILRAALPGFNRDDLEIQAGNKAIAIAGERNIAESNLYKSELRYGRFERLIRLPVSIDNTQIRAELTNGILTLTLPKLGIIHNRAVRVNLTRLMPEQLPQNDTEALEASSSQPFPQPLEDSSQQPSDKVVQSVVNDETDDVWAAQ
ncbi:MAG: Hsp20/alpha crystallin family protein [Cyanobacteriota bacterium]|nr:Hsp20/alpha crystallin family protein [Cyanobacteriota bacterium]